MIKLGEHQKVVYTRIIYPMASDSQEMLIQMIHILNMNMGHFGNIYATKTHESKLFYVCSGSFNTKYVVIYNNHFYLYSLIDRERRPILHYYTFFMPKAILCYLYMLRGNNTEFCVLT